MNLLDFIRQALGISDHRVRERQLETIADEIPVMANPSDGRETGYFERDEKGSKDDGNE